MKINITIILSIFLSTCCNALEVSTLTAESFQASGGLTVAVNGDILVANFGLALNNANGTTVYKIDSESGARSVFAAGFSGASGNTIGPDGLLYQSNVRANSVFRVESDGTLSTVVKASDGLVNPIGISFNSNRELFINNCGNNSISRMSTNGEVNTFSNSALLNCPNGLTIDGNDNLYAVNFNNGNIIKITASGSASIFATTPGSSSKPTGGNGHIIFANNKLYLVSNATNQVFSLSLSGELIVIAGDGTKGRKDGESLSAQFSLPNGIGISPDGSKLYVNDSTNIGSSFIISPNVVRVIQLVENVEPPLDGITPNNGLTGTWYEAETAGQGILIDINVETNLFFAAWFTFDSQAPSTQRWLTIQSALGENDTIKSIIYNTIGGVFDTSTEVNSEPVGQFNIIFTSCTTAEVEYSFDNESLQGKVSLTRLTSDIHCEDLLK